MKHTTNITHHTQYIQHTQHTYTHRTCSYGSGLGQLATLGCAAKGSLLSALRLGPSYALVTVKSNAELGLNQVCVGAYSLSGVNVTAC